MTLTTSQVWRAADKYRRESGCGNKGHWAFIAGVAWLTGLLGIETLVSGAKPARPKGMKTKTSKVTSIKKAKTGTAKKLGAKKAATNRKTLASKVVSKGVRARRAA